MAQNSKIEWTDHTCNLWWGCTKVTAGCDHCYAETLSKRWDHDVWGNDRPRREIYSFTKDLLRFQKAAKNAGQIHRVFVGSMMDIFEKPMPVLLKDGTIAGTYNTGTLRGMFFADITEGHYNNLLFLFLTKRPSNINKYIPESWKINPPKNVMFGTSPCDQATADKLIPQLLQVNGFKFLSVEPMLEPIDLLKEYSQYEPDYDSIAKWRLISGIDWVIVGGESGHGKRPFNCDWARALRKQCKESHVAFFMKQVDKIQPIPEDLMIREFPKLEIYG